MHSFLLQKKVLGLGYSVLMLYFVSFVQHIDGMIGEFQFYRMQMLEFSCGSSSGSDIRDNPPILVGMQVLYTSNNQKTKESERKGVTVLGLLQMQMLYNHDNHFTNYSSWSLGKTLRFLQYWALQCVIKDEELDLF